MLLIAPAHEFGRFPKGHHKIMTIERRHRARRLHRQGVPLPQVFALKGQVDNPEGGFVAGSDNFSIPIKSTSPAGFQGKVHPCGRGLLWWTLLANGGAAGIMDTTTIPATLAGIGIAVEKGFQEGGQKIRSRGIELKSLAIIESADENGITFRSST